MQCVNREMEPAVKNKNEFHSGMENKRKKNKTQVRCLEMWATLQLYGEHIWKHVNENTGVKLGRFPL